MLKSCKNAVINLNFADFLNVSLLRNSLNNIRIVLLYNFSHGIWTNFIMYLAICLVEVRKWATIVLKFDRRLYTCIFILHLWLFLRLDWRVSNFCTINTVSLDMLNSTVVLDHGIYFMWSIHSVLVICSQSFG